MVNKNFYVVSKANAEIIEKYLIFKKAQRSDISSRSLRNIKESLKKLSDFLKKKNLIEATKEDLQAFFSNSLIVKSWKSRDTYANHIIPFYRWVTNTDKHSRPENMKWFEYTTQREKRKHRDPERKEKLLITTKDYEKMINRHFDAYGQNNAIWEVFYLSGIRPEELLPLNIEHIKQEKDGNYSITIPSSKTMPRKIPLPHRPDKLIRYLEYHPQKDNPQAPLFFSFKSKGNIFRRLTDDALRDRFRKMKKELKLKDTYTIKSFRKTRATIIFNNKNFNDTYISMIMGWTPQTVIQRRQEYDLSNFDDLKKVVCAKPKKKIDYDTIKKENLEFNKMRKQITKLSNIIERLGIVEINGDLYRYNQRDEEYDPIITKNPYPPTLDKNKKPINKKPIFEKKKEYYSNDA